MAIAPEPAGRSNHVGDVGETSWIRQDVRSSIDVHEVDEQDKLGVEGVLVTACSRGISSARAHLVTFVDQEQEDTPLALW